ncbi:MAG: hypothetical protein ACE15B_18390 [Bryobacteraceae bacterium]
MLAAQQSPVVAVSPFGSEVRPLSASAAEPKPRAAGPLVVPRGTSLKVRLGQSIDTSRDRAGKRFTAHLAEPLMSGGHVLAPKGAAVGGHVTTSQASGRLRGRAYLGLTLDSIEINGRSYPIATSSVTRVSASHKKRNAALIGGGSGVGAAIGAIAGGAKGALIGAGAGAAAGTAGAAATGRRNVHLPAESLLTFTLRGPLTVE